MIEIHACAAEIAVSCHIGSRRTHYGETAYERKKQSVRTSNAKTLFGLHPSVSHTAGVEASATGPAVRENQGGHALVLASPGLCRAGHDLVRGRLGAGAVRD